MTTRIVYDFQVAAQALIERAGRGLAVLDEEIIAVANATSIPGTQLFEAVVEDASV